MVELKDYEASTLFGKITGISEQILRTLIAKENLQKFKDGMRLPQSATNWEDERIEEYKEARLGRNCLVIEYEMLDGTKKSEHFTIPTISGWGRSNIRLITLRNPDLPTNTKDWIGQKVKLRLDEEGFPEIAR